MSKVAHYLQEHLIGEVMTSTDARRYFATDGSVLQVAPALIVYPRNENDVRKTARFTWQLAERNRLIPITARGSGSGQAGGALGSGIILAFPAHMNRILELDTKNNSVTVEAGINFGKLQQTLYTHGRFVPPAPPSLEYSTVGGAISDNASGEKSVKYGDTNNFVDALRVVLANGEIIDTGRLSKRELNKKMGLSTFEGEVYRSIDALIEENHDLIDNIPRTVYKNSAGYNIGDVKNKDGFDLTPLFVGSQGTLGLITEAVVGTEPYNAEPTLIMAKFDSFEHIQSAILEFRKQDDGPSAIELIDGSVLAQVNDINPNLNKDILKAPFPKGVLIIEYDDPGKKLKKASKKAEKILKEYATDYVFAESADQRQTFWKLRQSVSTLIAHNQGLVSPVPIFDGSVPVDRIKEYILAVTKLFEANNLQAGFWGHAGDGMLSVMPKLNIGQVGDRQKMFRLVDEYNKIVKSIGGSISSQAGDGRLRAPYLEQTVGTDLYNLFAKVKKIFDPYGTLNPGVKFGTTVDDIKQIIRQEYSLDHIYDHLPK